ncbi:MAG: hypothetical protein HKM95_11770 [Inquilinus sp.]|nr:hypothetical protein [Inquilinus sp.]
MPADGKEGPPGRQAAQGAPARIAGRRAIAYHCRMMGDTNWFGILLLASALAIVAPGAFRRLRGNTSVPVYIAIWLGVVLALAGIYELFGPFRLN